MIVEIEGRPPRCRVVEADDCTRLHVAAGGRSVDEVDAALNRSRLGSSDGPGRVWLRVDALRTAARADTSVAEDWDDRFAAMLAYAGTQGWLDQLGHQVAAHVEEVVA